MLLSSSLSGFPVSSLCFSLCDQEGLVKDEPTKHDKNTTATPFVPLDIQIPAEAGVLGRVLGSKYLLRGCLDV